MEEWTILNRVPLVQSDGTRGDWGEYVEFEVWEVRHNPTKKVIDYAVVLEDDSVAVAGITERDEMILVSHNRVTSGVVLEAIAGGIKPSESIFEAAGRELLEEGGCRPQKLVYLGKHFQSSSRVVSRTQGEVVPRTEYLFLAFDLEQGALPRDEYEDIKLTAVPLEAIRVAVLDPEWVVPGFGQILTGGTQNLILKAYALGLLGY